MGTPFVMDRRNFVGILSLAGFASACARPPKQERWPHQMGELVRCGWFSFNVLEVEYKSQLGSGATGKLPQNGYLAIRLQATSSAGQTVSIPFLRLQTESGDWIPEVENASDLDGWLGVLRKVEPGATETGWMVFDTRPGNYGLLLTDGALDAEQTAFVRIPLQVSHQEELK